MFILLITLIVISSFKGSHKFPSLIGVPYCGKLYWGLNILMFIICAGFVKVLIDRLIKRDARKV